MLAPTARSSRLAALAAFATVALVVLALVPAVSLASPAAPTADDLASSDRVIVGWTDAGVAGITGPDAISGETPSVGARPDRVTRVTDAAGMQATWLFTLAVGGDVYSFPTRLAPQQMASTVAGLRSQAGVRYAEPDRILKAVANPPNDPSWTGAPQWDLSEGTTATTYGIDLLGAWDTTQGAGITVAVIDTGITTHPEFTGRTVAGYDFIGDTDISNDGNGRDADPSDPGDWVTSAESASGPLAGCTVTNSSWHGSHTAGTVGAATNNGVGVASVAPAARLQAVRVLGKCGGYTSDIADAIVWASGGTVSGVPANANVARVLSLSLGGSGSCGTTMQSAINGAIARGSAVVVAAGNSNADASSFSPANCAGVITVAATTRTGVRASFSNYGTMVEIAAPGTSIYSTINAGTQGPTSPTYAYYQGTSMSTPHVAGVAALLFAAKPSLTPAQVTQLIQQNSHPFASGGCSQGCGSGIVDAAKAVAAAVGGGGPTPVPSVTPTPFPTRSTGIPPSPSASIAPSSAPSPSASVAPSPTPTPSVGPSPSPTPSICTRGAPVVTVTPTTASISRGSFSSETIRVRNADAGPCGSSTFTLTGAVTTRYPGITSAFTGPTTLTVAPGATGASTARISVATTAFVGANATVRYTAARSAIPTSGSALVSVAVR